MATLSPRDRLIVALDVPTLAEALDAVEDLRDEVGAFKVGLELATAEGSRRVVESIHAAGGRVFYDGKFADIPNTVAGAARALAGLGAWMFDVHASAGAAAIAAAVAHRGASLVIAVTVLTSLDDAACGRLFGAPPATKVPDLARLAAEAGADGVVCSPRELRALRADPVASRLLAVVPGVRPAWADAGDQARIATPAEAVRDGADYLVVGRPVLRPPPAAGSRREAARRIVDEIAGA